MSQQRGVYYGQTLIPSTLFLKIFSPFVYIIKKFNLLIFKIFNIEKQKVTDASVREDIRNIINMHEDEGILLKDERDMLNGILDLKEMTVEKIMTHRKNIYSINIDQPEEYFKKISQSSFSRIPVWKENPNNILGVVHAKKLLTNINESGKIDLKNINDSTLDPWFIPETTKVKDQLNAFIDRHEKIAFVVDEYGELMGLISLEDIIEEIVGNIFDESDLSTIGIRKIGKNIFRVRGDVNIRDMNRTLDLNLNEKNSSTVAGFLIYETETFPDVGQTFTFNNILFEILNKKNNQITQLKITLPEKNKITH